MIWNITTKLWLYCIVLYCIDCNWVFGHLQLKALRQEIEARMKGSVKEGQTISPEVSQHFRLISFISGYWKKMLCCWNLHKHSTFAEFLGCKIVESQQSIVQLGQNYSNKTVVIIFIHFGLWKVNPLTSPHHVHTLLRDWSIVINSDLYLHSVFERLEI